MTAIKVKRGWVSMIILNALLLSLPYSGVLATGEIPPVEDVIAGKAKLPTIEDMTGGKVKPGDVIDKNNVDLVKEYLSAVAYESVKHGMVLRMTTLNLPPDKLLSKYFIEATERNRGKAVIDENGTVYYEKMGVLWPGGLPFTEPETGLQVMANVKYGRVWDDIHFNPNIIEFINPAGRAYKTTIMEQRYIQCTTRSKLPPLGMIPGFEDVLWKRISVLTNPLEVKGLGQYTVRYYDDAKHHDTGFAYLPSFKRTIRISASTWQDNIAGSDLTYGDGFGFQEPYSYWDFKLIGTKYMLQTWEPEASVHLFDEQRRINEMLTFDVNKKFVRFGWVITPLHVVEAIPRSKHLYGKKILYINTWPYWPSHSPIAIGEFYDRQMKLWKAWITGKNVEYFFEGDTTRAHAVGHVYDLQVGHMTHFWTLMELNQVNYKPKDITLKTLLEVGR